MVQACEALGLAAFVAVMVMAAVIMHDYSVAVSLNGNMLRQKREFWASLAFCFFWVAVGRYERVLDFIPSYDLSVYSQRFVWIPLGLLFVSMWRVWRVLHVIAEREPGKRQADE